MVDLGFVWNMKQPSVFFLTREGSPGQLLMCSCSVVEGLRSYSVCWGLWVSDTLHRPCTTTSVSPGARILSRRMAGRPGFRLC